MIFEAVYCPNCGELVPKNIQIDVDGTPFWKCSTCDAFHEDRSWYHHINQEKAIGIIENRKPFGLFVLDARARIIGIDNSIGDAWVEEFPCMIECLLWLIREKEV